MDGATRCIKLSENKQQQIITEIKTVLCIKSGVLFKRLEKLLVKLRHTAIGIPEGKNLFGNLNHILEENLKLVFWDRQPAARQNLRDWKQLIAEAGAEPTHVWGLLHDGSDVITSLDTSGEGAVGVWMPGMIPFEPTLWHVK